MTDYFCYPVCKSCTDSGTCVKLLPEMDSVPPDEYIRTRAVRNFNIPSAYLPCGCFGLPWPIIDIFGKDISEVLCENCGWISVKKGYKFSSEPPGQKKRRKKMETDGQVHF